MITTTCIQTHILRLQYLHARLGGMYVADLKTGGCRAKCFSTALEIASKYIDILYCYKAFPATPRGVVAIEATSISNVSEAINDISLLGFIAGVEYYDGKIFVWWYQQGVFILPAILACCDPIDPLIGVVYEDITTDPCELVSAWNCLTPSELCDILNHGYGILNVAEPDYGTALPESLDTHFLNL